MNRPATIWNGISQIGVRAGQTPEEQDQIAFSNGLFCLTALGCFTLAVISSFSEQAIIHRVLNLGLSALLLFAIALNHWQFFAFSRTLVIFTLSAVAGLEIVMSAGYFAQGVIFACVVVVVFIIYADQPEMRLRMIVWSSLIYVIAQCYLIFYPPLIESSDVPFDEVVVFLFAIGFMVWVLNIYDRQKSKLLDDMRVKNQNLQSLSKELERFAYIASHDLKSPLRTVNSFVGLMSKNIEEENLSEVRQNIAFVKKGVEQMSVTIDDILALSKISTTQDMPYVKVDLNQALEKAVDNLSSEIKKKGAVVDLLQKLPYVRGLDLDYVQLFQNLIQNGLRYNVSQQPIIRISHVIDERKITMQFEDNGIGIEEKYFEKIFEFFERLHHEAEYPGTGLGLALCQKIVQKNGGYIEVSSDLQKGSTFTVVLPHGLDTKEYV